LSARIVTASLIVDEPGNTPVVNEWLLKCPVPIDLEATAIHGINNEHADKFGVDSAHGIKSLLAALSTIDCPIVVVNASFDFSILYNEGLRYGIDATPVIERLQIIDTLVCDRWLDPYRPGRRTLTAVSAAYGIAIRGAHQSTGDCLCALRLARVMGSKYPEFANANLAALQGIQADAYRTWANEFREYQQMTDPEFDLNTEWPYSTEG
jgi:DNA polymerase-3 subunit epsilon